MASKVERFIVSPQPTKPEEVQSPGMLQARLTLGPQYNYMSSSLVPEADMSFALWHVEKKVPPGFKSAEKPHKHEMSQLYAIIGGLTVELFLEDERYEFTGPAAVFLPAGMTHVIDPLSGSGYLAVLTRSGKLEFPPSVKKEIKKASKTKRFIVSPQPAPDEVPYHNMRQTAEMLGPQHTYMSSALVPEADMALALRQIKQVPPGFKSEDVPHKHTVSQLYAIIGELTVAVIMDNERYETSGPTSVFIPAGISHTIHPLSGSGYLVVLTRSGKLDFLAP